MTTKEIYVEGLPYDLTEEAVKEIFSGVGNIVRTVIPRWNDSGRLKGYAIFEFETEAEAEAALKLNKKKLDGGRYLAVSFSKGKKIDTGKSTKSAEITADEQTTCKTLFIGNLPYDVTEDELNAVFGSYGPVEEIRVVSENGRMKGFAYIEYKKTGIVRRVMIDAERKPFFLKGRGLKVDYNTGNKRAGFHTRKEAYDSAYFKKQEMNEQKRKNIVKRV